MNVRILFTLWLVLAITPLFGQFSLITTSPSKNSSDVSIDQAVVLQFSDNVNTLTTASDFSIVSNFRGKLESTFSVSDNTVTLTPSIPFLISELITITIFTSLKSASDVPLNLPATLQFLVESKPAPRTPPTMLAENIISVAGIITMIEAADMDSDGDMDITALAGADAIWLENDGEENFSRHTIKTGISFPYLIKPVDLDKDGDLDLIASGHYAGMMIFENDGNQNFQQTVTIVGYGISSFDVADFDLNGEYDIVYSSVEGTSGNYVEGTYILYNQGSNTFNKVKMSSATFYQFNCVDLDNDNDFDIVYYEDGGIRYWLNSGATFTAHTIFSESNAEFEKVLIADVNNDARQDVVFLKYKYSIPSLQVSLNNGSLQFTSTKIELQHIYELSSVGDYDGDGDQDIMIMDGNYTYSMLENSGAMSFTKSSVASPLSGVYYPTNSINADFDEDGDLDFLASPSSTIKLYKNTLFPFEEKNSAGLKAITVADSDWGDYDSDGDLDLVTTGWYQNGGISLLYENQNGMLVEKHTELADLWLGSCDWGDYDNDGDLDILLTGASNVEIDDRGPKSLIYNNDNGEFRLLPTSTVQLPKIWYGEARWTDLNNDGKLDIAFNGESYAGVYGGDGQGNFVKQIDFPFSASWANVDMGDFDKDGDLDIAVSGYTGGAILSVLRNDGDWKFSEVSGNFVARLGGNVSWSDMDNDGDLDLVVSGTTRDDGGNGPPSITVYRNLGNNFSLIENTEFIYQGDAEGTSITGDFDNDGVQDLLTSTQGGSSYSPDINLFKNTGSGDLKLTNIELPNRVLRAINWIDFDRDNDLDLFAYPQFLTNNIKKKNTAPTPPTVVAFDSVYNNSLYFHWSTGQDDETPSAGLSYQIYVGTESGKQNIVNSNSYLNDGLRKVVESGKWKGQNARLEDLAGGIYSVGVQTIDAAFEGSAFSQERQFLVIGIHGNKGACLNSDYSYTAQPSGNYTWEITGGTILSGQGTDSIVVKWTELGRGFVKVLDGAASGNKMPVQVDRKPQPIINGDMEVCTGLQIYDVTDSLTYSTHWIVSGENMIQSEHLKSAEIEWQSAGESKIIVQAFSEKKGCFSYDTVNVQIDQRTSPHVMGSGWSCIDQVEKYSSESAKNQWSIINGNILKDSTKSILVKWASAVGEGSVVVEAKSERNYCSSQDTLIVTIQARPPEPTLTLFRDSIVLSSDSPTDFYKWYYNNQLVVQGPYVGVIPNVSGEFVVEIFNSYGCSSKSMPFDFQYFKRGEEGEVQLFPNPATELATVRLKDGYIGNVEVSVYNSSGVRLSSFNYKKTSPFLHYDMDVSMFESGNYLVLIRTGSKVYAQRFMKY